MVKAKEQSVNFTTLRARAKGYEDLLDSAFLADFTIKRGSVTIKLHRTVLCAESEYFSKLIQGDFQETKNDQAEFVDHPALMARVVQFLYFADYDEGMMSEGQLRHIQDPYADENPVTSSLLHAHVFEIACRICHDDLKEIARRRFARTWFLSAGGEDCVSGWRHIVANRDTFTEIVCSAYATPENERGLRDPIVYTVRNEIGFPFLWNEADARLVLSIVPALCQDLVFHRYLTEPLATGGREFGRTRKWACVICDRFWLYLSRLCEHSNWPEHCDDGSCQQKVIDRAECWECFTKRSANTNTSYDVTQ